MAIAALNTHDADSHKSHSNCNSSDSKNEINSSSLIVFMIIMAVIGVTSPTLARALAEARGGTGPDPQTGQAARAPEAKNSTQILGVVQ